MMDSTHSVVTIVMQAHITTI